MTLLLKKLILVLVPTLVLLGGFEILARTIPTSYAAKNQRLFEQKGETEVLVLGSSHANYGIDPQYFGREAYNLSNMSQCLYQDWSVLSRYLPELKKLKLVILPISYFTLKTDLALSPEAWRCGYYSVYMGVKGAERQSPLEIRSYSALALWDGPIGVLKNLRKVKGTNLNRWGYQAPEAAGAGGAIGERTGRERVAYHDGIMHENLVPTNLELLNRIADTLKARHVKLVVVTTPVYKTYSRNVSAARYRSMTGIVEQFSRNKSVPYLNYFLDQRFEREDFLDNDHLNERGARKFSAILRKEAIDPLL